MNLNEIFLNTLSDLNKNGIESQPRDLKVKELIGYSYHPIKMGEIITLSSRKMNYKFMFDEAAWIVGGNNLVAMVNKNMKKYENFSDDSYFMNGAYGPKFIDQIPYILQILGKDEDSRQAVVNIWREKPGESKDIPCTLNLQFLIRNNKIEAVVNMRSNDIIWGFCYDVFTFSCMTQYIRLLLNKMYNKKYELGNLHLSAGSVHIYSDYWNWLESSNSSTHELSETGLKVQEQVNKLFSEYEDPMQFPSILSTYSTYVI